MGFGPTVDVAWLRGHLGEAGLAVVDCRWRLGEPGAGERAYLDEHVPGAAFLDVDRDLSSPPGAGGRHPLPEAAAFEAAAGRAGIRRESRVVAYDEAGEGGAVRLWWLLRHFGHHAAAVLDGGLRAWREVGGPVSAEAERIEPGDFEARPRSGDTADADELLDLIDDRGMVLLDARAPERFMGVSEPLDPVAGHIPGAVNVPYADLAPGGRFLPAPELRRRLGKASRGRQIVAYCGSGVTSCTLVLAAELAGVGPARLYPGSWSEWSGRGLPAEAYPGAAR